jgi:uric acid transporter
MPMLLLTTFSAPCLSVAGVAVRPPPNCCLSDEHVAASVTLRADHMHANILQDLTGLTMDQIAYTKVGSALAEDSSLRSAEVLTLRYGLEDKPAAGRALLYGLQHVLIMFSAMVASPLVIGQLLNLSAELRSAMITGVMLGCGVGTLISALGVGWIGARLPLLLGAYTVYIGPVVAIAKNESLGAAAAALLIGAVFLLAISPIIGRFRFLFPPIVVGALLVITGFTLIKIAMGVAFAVNTPYFGNPLTVAFLVGSVALITVIATVGNRLVKSLSVLSALIVTYAAAACLGLGNFAAIAAAPWFRIPALLPFGLAWPGIGGVTTIVIYHLVAAIYTMSITLALCAMIGVEPSAKRVGGAVAGDGLGSILAILFGGVPLISYDQNVGAISLTGVASRFVVAISGAILVVMAFLPKIGAIVGLVPPFVLGGTLVFMFGMIVVVGIKIISAAMTSQRELLILAASFGLCAVVNYAPPTVFDLLPPSLRILAGDGIVVGTLVAVVLNLALPASKPPPDAP